MRPREHIRRAVLAALAAAVLVGCARAGERDGGRPSSRSPEPACSCDGTPLVDPTLLAFLSKARAAHHDADVSLAAGDPAAAIRALEQILNGPKPAGSPPEVAEVCADTYARLAELRSDAGDFDAAARDVEAGLKLAPAPSHYQGHLFEVAGVVDERRAKALEARGDHDGAATARRAAIASFERAISVQDQVINEALKGTAKPIPEGR